MFTLTILGAFVFTMLVFGLLLLEEKLFIQTRGEEELRRLM